MLGESLDDNLRALAASVRNNIITIAQSANSRGKTFLASRLAIWFYKSFPRSQVYTCAAPPESNLKRMLWGEISSFVYRRPALFSEDSIKTLHIERDPLSFITGVSIPTSGSPEQREAKFSGKHAPALLFIVDEGDAVPDEVYKGIESCMSGGFVRLLIMYNPRAESGTPYRYARDGRGNVISLSAFTHPNVITGENVVDGAVSRETVVRRINEWTEPLKRGERPAEDCFEIPDFLVGSSSANHNGGGYAPLEAGYRRIIDPAFSYMVLGEYPSKGGNQLISRTSIAKARSRYDVYVAKHGRKPPVGVKAIGGLDVADEGDDHNAACFRYGGYVPMIETWRGVDPLRAADYFLDMLKDPEDEDEELKGEEIDLVNVDGTGVGASSAPYLQRQGLDARKIMVASSPTYDIEQGEFGILRDQLFWSLREWLRTDTGAMLPPDEKLLEELKTPTYSIKNGKIKVMDKDTMKKALGRSPDRMDALCLTFANEGGIQFF